MATRRVRTLQGCLALILSVFSLSARAEEPASPPPSDPSPHQTFGLHYIQLSADPGTPLVGQGTGTGFGFEVTAYRGGPVVELMGRTRFGYAMGQAKFTDGEDVRELTFRLLSGEIVVGARVNLISVESSFIQPYFGLAGKVGLNSLSLPEVSFDSTSLSRTMTGRTLGLEWVSGFEIARAFFVEFQLRTGAGTVGNLPLFQVGGAALALGFSW